MKHSNIESPTKDQLGLLPLKRLCSPMVFIKPALIIALTCYLASCKKFVNVDAPINQITSEVVFTTDKTATAAVTGLYNQMMTSNLYFMNGAMSVYTALSADELVNTTTSTSLDPFTLNALTSSNSIVQNNLWRYAYNYIYQANACLEGVTASQTLSDAVKTQLTGEMLFARACCYFYLVNVFGDVPLETTTDYETNRIAPRTASSSVYEQIIADLIKSENLLPATYPVTGKVRPNKYAVAALLARVYLYRKDYSNAEAQATTVIASNSYSLVSDLNSVFLANSNEAIWQLAPVTSTFNTAEGASFLTSSTTVKPTYALSSYLLNAFEAGDQRKTAWLKSNTVSSVAYYYPYKYKVLSSSTKTEYNNVLRLAEVYLIRAEARALQNNISEAVNDLNIIRDRARAAATTAVPNPLPPFPASLSQTQCLAAIAQENRIEFFAEWGHRWLDLKRTGQADAVLGTTKTGWQSTDALYPIPYNELQKNVYLVQNPGYNP